MLKSWPSEPSFPAVESLGVSQHGRDPSHRYSVLLAEKVNKVLKPFYTDKGTGQRVLSTATTFPDQCARLDEDPHQLVEHMMVSLLPEAVPILC